MSSLTDFGLNASGLTIPRQQDFATSLATSWQAAFGANVNLDPRSNNGQIINIMAERFAYLAELLEAIYAASYPSGAEGVAVDNLLALQGLTRLSATPTKTAQSPVTGATGITAYGFVCFGDPGTNIPAGSLVSDNAAPPNNFATDAPITIGAAQNAVQTIVLTPPPTSGSFALNMVAPNGTSYQTSPIPYNAAGRVVALNWTGTPGDQYGSFRLALVGYGTTFFTTSSPIGYLTGAAMAQEFNGQFGTNIVGTGDAGSGIYLDFGAAPVPTIVPSGVYPPTVTTGIQGVINAVVDATTTLRPFTDVAATRTGNVITLTFGGNTPVSGQPATAATALPLVTLATNALYAGTTQSSATVSGTIAGQPAQGVGSATAVAPGPTTVSAGSLTNIVTPVSGWSACTNQLDCQTGNDDESDAEALARRASLVANQAQGPLAAILQRVRSVPGVSAATAFANTSMAAQQVVRMSAATTGTFVLVLSGQTTAPLPYNVTAGQLQAALRALPSGAQAAVTGSVAAGFAVDWGTSNGGQALPLMTVANNTTGVGIVVAYGRYPKAIELVVEGGADADVAAAIFAAAPAGLSTYGQPVLATTLTTSAGSAVVTALSTTGLTVGLGVTALGVPPGSTVTSIAQNNVTLSAAALTTYNNTPATFGHYVPIIDSAGNGQIVNFSRPTLVPIFVSVSLVTDLFVTPGDPTSGSNAASRFNPATVPTIQSSIKAVIDSYGIGATLIATGTQGIASAFRDVAGIEDATVAFDTVSPPQNTARLTLQSQQVADIELANILVSFV